MIRHTISPIKSFLLEKKAILGQEREKWKGEADVVSAQWCLGRKASVGKNVEEETKGLDCF